MARSSGCAIRRSPQVGFEDALPVIEVEDAGPITPGQPNAAGTRCSLDALEMAAGLVRAGSASGLVTGPVSKAQLYAIGFNHPGQTEFVAERFGVSPGNVAMMLAGPTLRTVPITVHERLAKVPSLLSVDLVVTRARTVARGLQRDFGIEQPRLAFAGFNPHAGENGALGDEEQLFLLPAIEQLRAEGIACLGPLAADTMFHERARARYDVAICLLPRSGAYPAQDAALRRRRQPHARPADRPHRARSRHRLRDRRSGSGRAGRDDRRDRAPGRCAARRAAAG